MCVCCALFYSAVYNSDISWFQGELLAIVGPQNSGKVSFNCYFV
jgi:hypothetical protein